MEDFIVFNSSVTKENLKKLNIFVSENAVVQDGAKLYFNCCVLGESVIYSSAVVHTNSTVVASVVAGECEVFSSRIENSELSFGSTVGPFAYVLNSKIGERVKIGNFSVLKSCLIADNVKIASLVNIENAEIGINTEIEAGVKIKSTENKVLIGDNVKIKTNACVVQPVDIEDEAIIESGTVVCNSVFAKEIASNKQKQHNIKIK